MDPKKQLGFLKQQTENIDLEIVLLLKRRLQTQKRIFDVQVKNNLPIGTEENDIDTMDIVSKKARDMDISDTFIHAIYSTILDETQEMKKNFETKK